MIWHFFLCCQCTVFLPKWLRYTRHLRKAMHHPVKQGYKCKNKNYDILLSQLCCKCMKSNNNINNNKDFYSAISIGSWHFTTEYFKLKILEIKKIYINNKKQIYEKYKLKLKIKKLKFCQFLCIWLCGLSILAVILIKGNEKRSCKW